jgi:hypothetical protein
MNPYLESAGCNGVLPSSPEDDDRGEPPADVFEAFRDDRSTFPEYIAQARQPAREPGEDPVELPHTPHGVAAEKRFPMLTASELAAGDFTVGYIIEDVVASMEFCILVGPKKSLKTTLALLMAVCIVLARPLFGIFHVRQRMTVGYFSGESGKATLKDALRRIAAFVGRSPGDFPGLHFCFSVPRLDSQADVDALESVIKTKGLQVAFLDCFYRMLGEAADGTSNMFKMGSLLGALMDLQDRTGCLIILLHHTRMHSGYDEPDLDDAAFAGIGEAARQWVLLNRRCKYDPDNAGHHELWFAAGGSAGHSELVALNIEEGSRKDPSGRRFELELLSAGEARGEAATAQEDAKEQRRRAKEQKRLNEDRQTLLRKMRSMEAPDTKTGIRENHCLPPVRFNAAWGSLAEDKTIVFFGDVIKGNNQAIDGFCLAEQLDKFRSRQQSSIPILTGAEQQ